MNVLIVSECDKRALVETRRIVDQFAERKGRRTWQTPITEAGLNTLRSMLRRTARKNTAVACHWVRGLDYSELLWIVGDASRFNADGSVPTNWTERDVLRKKHESEWQSHEGIHLAAKMAALFHDFGKASNGFQAKLRSSKPIADAYRHEWVSVVLFDAFVNGRSDDEWIEELQQGKCELQFGRLDLEGCQPFKAGRLGPVAQAVAWFVISHHRLPTPLAGKEPTPSALRERFPALINANWASPRVDAAPDEKAMCGRFSKALPTLSAKWRSSAMRCARRLQTLLRTDRSAFHSVLDPYVAAIGRFALMLADHHYSSVDPVAGYGDPSCPLFANTDRDSGALKQRLDEHLVGVSVHTSKVMRSLLSVDDLLPRIARHRGFRKRSADPRFRWQDKAFDLAEGIAVATREQGFFGINMASTGCGKTLANGRIMYGLSNEKLGARFTIALGLRTLTLQTGTAYRERLGLGDDDLAVLIGSAAVRDLYEQATARAKEEWHSSESASPLLEETSHVHFTGSLDVGPLAEWLKRDPRIQKMVSAPVLTCTIDNLIGASESTRGGHQIGPMLRLMSSDLVLDEPDEFGLEDLPALARLVHVAGLLGSRVLLSSATLSPSLVAGLFEAYLAGRSVFQRHRREKMAAAATVVAWFDEFGCQHSVVDQSGFAAAHRQFVDRRLVALRALEPRRRVEIVPFATAESREVAIERLADELPTLIRRLHQRNGQETGNGKRVSVGLLRLANVDPIYDLAKEIAARDCDFRLHLCVYHSKFPLLVRSGIEEVLDRTLKRNDPNRFWSAPAVRTALEADGIDHVLLVLASPVAEVGRDHDYDWAIVEPSSMRSLVQLAGRVRRHREEPWNEVNILLLERNLRAASGQLYPYTRPGYESKEMPLAANSMYSLLRAEELARLDASSRVVENDELQPKIFLNDLEHRVVQRRFNEDGREVKDFAARTYWRLPLHLSGLLQSKQRFRASAPQINFAWLPENDDWVFSREVETSRRRSEWTDSESSLTHDEVSTSASVHWWGSADFERALVDACTTDNLDDESLDSNAAKRFSVVSLDERDAQNGWSFHPRLGLRRRT